MKLIQLKMLSGKPGTKPCQPMLRHCDFDIMVTKRWRSPIIEYSMNCLDDPRAPQHR
jgi:hypothetical protein